MALPRNRILFYLAALLAIVASAAQSATIHVPKEYQFIQQAIQSARVGDTILIAPGTYTEEFGITKTVRLQGDPLGKVIIQSTADRGPVMHVQGIPDATIENIHFKHIRPQDFKTTELMGVVNIINSDVTIKNCKFENGAGDGLRAVGSHLVVDNCEAFGNRRTGIYLDNCSASQVFEISTHDNGRHGLAIVNPSFRRANVPDKDGWIKYQPPGSPATPLFPRLHNVTSENNRGCGFFFPENVTSVLAFCTTRNNGETCTGEVRALVLESHIDQLEAMATHFRTNKTRSVQGYWAMEQFYNGLGGAVSPKSTADVNMLNGVFSSWKDKYPKSVAPHIGEVELLIKRAWGARGGGTANTVSPQGWEDFRRYLDEAEDKLERIEAMNAGDPHLYAAWSTVGMGLSYPKRGMKQIREKAIALDPDYSPVYTTQAYAMLPRWLGNIDDAEKIADEAMQASTNGSVQYAFIAGTLLQYEDPAMLITHFGFDYDIIKAGHEEYLKLFPDNTRFKNSLAMFAVAAQDADTAAYALELVGTDVDNDLWGSKQTFDAAVAWNNGNGDPPFVAPPANVVPVPGRAPEVNWFVLLAVVMAFVVVLLAGLLVLIYFAMKHRKRGG